MPGLAAGYGAGKAAEAFRQILQDKFTQLAAQQALAEKQAEQKRQGDQFTQTLALQRDQLASLDATRKAAEAQQGATAETGAFSGALNEAQPGQDVTALANQYQGSANPAVQARLAALRVSKVPDVVSLKVGQTSRLPGTTEYFKPGQAPTEPLESVVDQDTGLPKLVKRSQAEGQQPYERPQAGSTVQLTPDDMSKVELAAKAVINHQSSPSQAATQFGGMGGNAAAFKRAVNLRVLELKPDFNFQEAESNYQFGKAPATQSTVRYLDNISKTVPVLKSIIDKVDPATIQVVNRASMAASRQFGDDTIASFDFARTILADEIAKVLQGGGTGSGTSDAKLQQAGQLLSGDMSKAQWNSVLNTINDMLSARRDTLTQGTYLNRQQNGPKEGDTKPVTLEDGTQGVAKFTNGKWIRIQ